MNAPPSETGNRPHALVISSDSAFVNRAMDVLGPHMRVAFVSAADSGLEAVAQSTDPDLFIIDIDDVDWQVTARLTTVERIRALFPDAPIAFTSSDISTNTLIPAMRAGANDVIDKNASADEILAVTDQLTSRRPTRHSAGNGRVVTTMGLRAGVGTTTLSLALAQAILETDWNLGPVLYLDFSAAPSEAADLLGVEPNYTMFDAVNDLGRLDGSVVESAFTRSANGLYMLPFALDEAAPSSHEVNEIPNLIYVLQNYFRYIFVGPNRHAFLRSVLDRLFCDSDVSILCTDQSVTSIHACSDFLRNIRQFVATEPKILLAITRYDPRISPDADRIAHTIGIGQDYQIIPWDRQHVDSHRNAGLPLIHPNARSPFADSIRRFMARIDEDFAAAHRKSRKGRQKWRRLLRLNR